MADALGFSGVKVLVRAYGEGMTPPFSATITVDFPCPRCGAKISRDFPHARNMVAKTIPLWCVEGKYLCSECNLTDTVTVMVRNGEVTIQAED